MEICKYYLKHGMNTLQVPLLTEFVSFELFDGHLCVWAKVNTREEVMKVKRSLQVVYTGEKIHEGNFKFIGTTIDFAKKLVYHCVVFHDRIRDEPQLAPPDFETVITPRRKKKSKGLDEEL